MNALVLAEFGTIFAMVPDTGVTHKLASEWSQVASIATV
jgi:hypothetical protein